MKQITLFLIISIFFSACEKEEPYISPVVKTISATLQEDGSVEVIGELTQGDINDTRLGIMRNANEPPFDDIEEASVEVYGKRFKTTFYGFEKYTPYYFMAYALDDNGRKLGNVVKIDSIYFSLVEVPCDLADNKLDFGTGFQNINYVSKLSPYTDETFRISSEINDDMFWITFYGIPRSGVYKTITSSPTSGKVWVTMQISFKQYQLNDGFDVYVNELSEGVYSISICDADFNILNSKVKFKGNIVSPR